MNSIQVEKAINMLGDNPTFKSFIDNFECFSLGPNGANKLRELIFEIAASGSLLQHDKNELLEKNYGKLGEYCELVMGQAPPGKDCNKDGEGTIFVKTGEFGAKFPVVKEWTTKPLKFAKKGDVLICVVGATIGKLNLGIDCAIGRSVAAIRPSKKLNTNFLYYSLMPFTIRLRNDAKGSAQGVIGKKNLNEVDLWVPSVEEQKRIVTKVDELMALCDQLESRQQQQANTLLKASTASIKALLSPENGKDELTNNWQRLADNFHTLYGNTLPMPPGEGRQKKYLVGRENIKSLRQAIVELAFKGNLTTKSDADGNAFEHLEEIRVKRKIKIEAGEIKNKKIPPLTEDGIYPHHWASVRLLELTELITKGSSPKWQGVEYIEERDDAVLFVTSENVSNYSINLTKKKYVEPKFNEIEPRSILKKGDLLTNIVGASIGRTAEFDLNDIANINQAVCIIRLLESSIDKRFLLHFFNSDYCLSLMFENQVENARANLSMGNIEKFIIPFPPLEEQKRIVNKIDQLMSLCDQIEQQLTTAYDQAEKLIIATTKALVA